MQVHKISVNDCTAVGLIHAGILPQPPLWEMEQMKLPVTEEKVTTMATVTSKRI
jgi:hypothetical protein